MSTVVGTPYFIRQTSITESGWQRPPRKSISGHQDKTRLFWCVFCALSSMIAKTILICTLLVHAPLTGHTQSTLPPPEVNIPNTELPEVQSTVSTPPEAQFPGGYTALQKYMRTHFEFDSIVSDQDYLLTQSRVYLRFEVSADGSITNARVIRGISTRIDRYCIRFIKEMPNWIPAHDLKGNPITSTVSFPIIIRLDWGYNSNTSNSVLRLSWRPSAFSFVAIGRVSPYPADFKRPAPIPAFTR